MAACPSCGRDSSGDDRFCPACGHKLPVTLPPSLHGGAQVLATFGLATPWAGKTLTYENGQFILEGHGPITPEAVLAHERQGCLVWPYEGLRKWALAVASRPAVPAPASRPGERGADDRPAATDGGSAEAGGSRARRRAWTLPSILLIAFGLVAVAATIVEDGYIRDGIGIACAVMAGALAVLGIVSVVRPSALDHGAPALSPSGPSSGRLPVILACLCAAFLALAAVLWWLPHYQVVVPADKRVGLDEAPAMTVMVKNRGLLPGTYKAVYALAGQPVSSVRLALNAGQEQAVTLSLPPDSRRARYVLELGSTKIPVEVVSPARFRVRLLEVDPPVAKVRQAMKVVASVKNTGGITGTFPGVMLANGREVGTRPTEVEAGGSATIAFTVSQSSRGPCRLRLGNARTTVMVVRPVRPPNGKVLRRRISGGRAHLTIKNSNEIDALFILARTRSPRTPVLAVYVRRSSSATVRRVPDGRYVAWDCVGRDWNAYTRGFLATEEYSRWRDPLVFATTRSRGHVRWRNWTLTLGSGPSEQAIVTSSRRFPKL